MKQETDGERTSRQAYSSANQTSCKEALSNVLDAIELARLPLSVGLEWIGAEIRHLRGHGDFDLTMTNLMLAQTELQGVQDDHLRLYHRLRSAIHETDKAFGCQVHYVMVDSENGGSALESYFDAVVAGRKAGTNDFKEVHVRNSTGKSILSRWGFIATGIIFKIDVRSGDSIA